MCECVCVEQCVREGLARARAGDGAPTDAGGESDAEHIARAFAWAKHTPCGAEHYEISFVSACGVRGGDARMEARRGFAAAAEICSCVRSRVMCAPRVSRAEGPGPTRSPR
eukprot:4795986-Prymnesium_polylepis.1